MILSQSSEKLKTLFNYHENNYSHSQETNNPITSCSKFPNLTILLSQIYFENFHNFRFNSNIMMVSDEFKHKQIMMSNECIIISTF